MKILKGRLKGSEYVGLFGLVSDGYALLPEGEENIFSVKSVSTTLAGTNLLGIFAVGNSQGVVVPEMVGKEEVEKLRDAGIEVGVYKGKYTALGNLVACNDYGCAVSSLIRATKVFKETLGVEVTRIKWELVGSSVFVSNRGFLAHPSLDPGQLKEIFGVEGDSGTVNGGDPFVGAGILGNSKTMLIGDECTPLELMKITEVFG